MKPSWKQNKYVCAGLTAFLVVAALMVFSRLLFDFAVVGDTLAKIANVLLPFIVGLILAYLLAPIYDFVEKPTYKWFAGKNETPRRFAKVGAKIIASVAAVLFLFAVVGGLLSMVIPQVYHSVVGLVNTLSEKSTVFMAWINEVAGSFGNGEEGALWLSQGLSKLTEGVIKWAETDLLDNLGGIAKEVSTGVINVIGTVTNVLIGVIICVYTLNSKELFAAQAKKITYSLFKTSTANYIVHMTRYIDQTFGRFINGMLIDALMVGILCFIGTSILGMPYALLLSVIVGLFNIVPIFGPISAAVIGTFFVLLESPIKAVIFVAFVLVLQQIDGNIVAPKILGQQTGLPSFWVIFAIVLGGGLFGLTGMILGVPTFAVVYALIQQYAENRLAKKSIPEKTEAFDGLWEIDETTGEPKYEAPSKEVFFPTRENNENE